MIEITATFEDGVLKPHEPLHLLPQSRVRLSIQPLTEVEGASSQRAAWSTIEQLWRETAIDSGGERLTREELHERR